MERAAEQNLPAAQFLEAAAGNYALLRGAQRLIPRLLNSLQLESLRSEFRAAEAHCRPNTDSTWLPSGILPLLMSNLFSAQTATISNSRVRTQCTVHLQEISPTTVTSLKDMCHISVLLTSLWRMQHAAQVLLKGECDRQAAIIF